MYVDDRHRLTEARWRPSDHYDERPAWALPELVVIHCVSLPEGQYGTGHPAALFTGQLDFGLHADFADLKDLQVSPHVLIDRQGSVEQFVSFDKRAWHAGVSCWHGRLGCNAYSIGIELEGSIHAPYTLQQYDALVSLSAALLHRYETLSVDAFVGHNEIAPGRKQDPGSYFDWCGFLCGMHRQAIMGDVET